MGITSGDQFGIGPETSSLPVLYGVPRTVHRRRGFMESLRERMPRTRAGKIMAGLALLGATDIAMHQQVVADKVPACDSRVINWGGPMDALPKGCAKVSDPVTSKAEWVVSSPDGENPAGQTVISGLVDYEIKSLATKSDTSDIGVVVSLKPDEQKLSALSGFEKGSLELIDQINVLTTTGAYTSKMEQSLGAAACVADMNEIIDRAQLMAHGLLVDGSSITVEDIRGAESLYDIKGHGGNAEDTATNNIFVVFDSGEGNFIPFSCAPAE